MTDNFESRIRAERDRLTEKIDRASKIVAALDVLISAYADDLMALEGPKVCVEPRPHRPPPKPSVGNEKPVDQVTYTQERKDWIRSMIAAGITRFDMLKSLNKMPGRPIAGLGALNAQVKAMGLSGANPATPNPSIVEAKPKVVAEPAAEPAPAPAHLDDPAGSEPDEDDPHAWRHPPVRSAPPPPPSVLTVRTADIVAWATQAGVADPRNLFAVNKARLARGLPIYGLPADGS